MINVCDFSFYYNFEDWLKFSHLFFLLIFLIFFEGSVDPATHTHLSMPLSLSWTCPNFLSVCSFLEYFSSLSTFGGSGLFPPLMDESG